MSPSVTLGKVSQPYTFIHAEKVPMALKCLLISKQPMKDSNSHES
jgi:hypothetical protein